MFMSRKMGSWFYIHAIGYCTAGKMSSVALDASMSKNLRNGGRKEKF